MPASPVLTRAPDARAMPAGVGSASVSQHPNVAIVRRFYQAFISRDTATIWALSGENVEFHVPGRSRFAGTHKGRDEILRMFHETGKAAGHSIKIRLHALMGGDDHVVGLHHITGSREGRTLDQNACLVAHVTEGVMVDVWLAFEDLKAFDRFWT